MHYLALGDSYTIGEGIAPEQRWPTLLCNAIHQEIALELTPEIIAQTGWTTSELIDALPKSAATSPYTLVTLLIGVNNQYRKLDLDTYASEFETLLDQALAWAGNQTHRVIVLSIPDWGFSPFAHGRNRRQIRVQIDRFNAVNEAIAARKHCPYVNLTPLTRSLSAPKHFADDGLHPSAMAYEKWVEHMLPTVLESLKQQD